MKSKKNLAVLSNLQFGTPCQPPSKFNRPDSKVAGSLLIAFAGLISGVNAADNTWNGSTSGAWNTAANWTTVLPNGDNARFTGSTPNNAITLATSVPIFQLDFASATLGNYTFSGSQFQTSGSGANIPVQGTVTNGATLTWNNNIQTTTTNRVNPGGFSISTASLTNANLVFNGNLFASVGTAGIISGIDFKLSNAAAVGSTTVNGQIINSGLGKTGITKTGGGQGVLTLNGANTFSGGTDWNVDSGSFVLGNKSALGTGMLRANGTSTAGLISASTALTGANAVANTINFGSVPPTTTTSNAVITFVSGTPDGTLVSGVSPNVGDVVTVGAQYMPIYAIVTAVSGATISFDTNATASGNGTLTTKAFNASSTGTFSVAGTNAIEFSGTQNLTTVFSNGSFATRTYAITNTADTTFSGVLQELNGVAGLTKTGAGKLILTNANTYSGNTTISAGILQLGDGGTTGSLAIPGTLTNNGNLTINRSNTVVQGTDFNTAAITGSGSLTHAGAGTVILTAANTFNGATTINAGTLQLGNGGATGSLNNASAITNNGILVFNRTGFYNQTNLIGGSGSVLMTAALGTAIGTVAMTNAASSYTGTTTIQNGDINVGANSILAGTNGPLGNAASAIILGTAGTQTSSSGGGFGPNAAVYVTSAGAAANYSITRDVDSSATANVTGRSNIRFNGPVASTGTLTVSSNWTLGTGASRGYGISAQQAGQTLDFTGLITGPGSTGTFRINDYGAGFGVVRMSNTGNNYAGPTTVTNGTLLIAGDAGASSGVLGSSATLNVAEGGNAADGNAALTDGAFTVGKTITLQNGVTTTSTWSLGGNQAAISSFTGNINTTATVNSRTLRLTQVAGGTVTFSGVIGANSNITGATSIDKIGLGTVNLTVANTYDGDTTVTDGILSMSAPAMSDTSTLRIGTVAASPAVLNLPNAGTDIVGALYIDGVLQPTNTLYDSTNSGGAITGPGKIQVGVVALDDYGTWRDSFTYYPGADTTPTGDADGDGLTNQYEYAFGLLPNSGSSVNAITVLLSKSTGKFRYTRRTVGLPSPAIVYSIQTSTTLAGWTTDMTADQQVVGTVGEVQTVEVTLTAPAPLTATALFVRVLAK